ncbi:MAG: hypothetical protein R3207_10020, partial [Oceanospirillum sp.]|nr:hypothetical protein [Oceanospirillum sp.]
NPSLTITALSEYIMSHVPVHNQALAEQVRPIRFSQPSESQQKVLDEAFDGVVNKTVVEDAMNC